MVRFWHQPTLCSDIAVLGVQGEVDVRNFEELESQLRRMVERGCRRILLDFGELDFMSTEGARVVHDVNRFLSARGGELTIVGASRRVQRLFTVIGMDGLMQHAV